MSLQAFVWAVRTLTLLTAGAFGLLILFLDPDVVGIYGSILFYLLGGLLFYGMSYLFVLGVCRIFFGEEKAVFFLGATARLAGLAVTSGTLILTLIQSNLWYWWSVLLVAAFILLLEFTLRALWKKNSSE